MYLCRRKHMTNNNNNNKASRNIRGKKAPIRKKKKKSILHTKKNLYNILKTKKIKQKITSMNNPYIRCSNENTLLTISKTSSLPRIKSTKKQKKLQS